MADYVTTLQKVKSTVKLSRQQKNISEAIHLIKIRKMLLIERKHTPLGKTYWGGEGAYSKEGNEISKRLVETSETHIPTNVHGRLMSAVNMLIYDFGNNGNGNIIEKVMRD